MKKINTLIITFLLANHYLLAQPSTIVLETQHSGTHTYIARDAVKMMPGFNYKALSGFSFTAKTDETIICDADYIDVPISPEHRPLDTSLPVGSIMGMADVSPSGAALYQIPIHIPQGIAGMQPAVSVVYNSQDGDGMLGMGWNISGLSAISRVSKTIYHEGASGGINFRANNDKYSLDGNRLLALNGNYGEQNTTYETEIKTFSKIESFGRINEVIGFLTLNTGPEWFKVTTKEGTIIEYGNSPDSRFVPGASTIRKAPYSWLINKITDPNGNFITFSYRLNNGQVLIDKIQYTANGGNQPVNAIHFFYDTKSNPVNNYLSGRPFNNSHILRKIKVITEGETVRTYSFSYFTDKGRSYLNLVDEKLGDNKSLNSTVVSWGNNDTPISVSNTTVPSSFHDYEYFVPYDFDGDGFSDIIAIKIGDEGGTQSSNTVQVFKANYTNGSLGFDKHGEPFGYCCDGYPSFNHLNVRLNLSVLRLRNYSYDWGGRNAIVWPQYRVISNIPRLHFQNILTNGIKLENKVEDFNLFPIYTIGDFSNNGVDEIVYFERIKKNGVYPGNIVDVDNFVYDQPPNISLTEMNKKPERIFTFDFNSDGLLDIVVLNEDGLYLYSNNTYFDSSTGKSKTEFVFVTSSNQIKSTYSVVELGDFNGDGLTDFIFCKPHNEFFKLYYLAINNGNNSFEIIPTSIITQPFSEMNYCKVIDFNNDGKDDVLVVSIFDSDGSTVNTAFVDWHQSVSTGFQHIRTNQLRGSISGDSKNFINTMQIGDFNGDGILDIFTHKGDLLNTSQPQYYDEVSRVHSAFNPLFDNGLVRGIKDGMGIETNFEYQPITHTKMPSGEEFYSDWLTHNVTYPLRPIQAPLYCVRNVSGSDGVGGTLTTNYSYQSARVNLTGRGFLGFLKLETNNQQLNRQSLIENTFDSNVFLLKNSKTQSKISGATVAITETDYTHSVTGNTIFSYLNMVKSSDYLKGITTTTSYTYENTYGNLQKILSLTSDGLRKEINFSNYAIAGSHIPSKPQLVEAKKLHSDHDWFSLSTSYTYNSTTGNVETEVTNYGTDKQVTTSYQNYNSWGFPQTIISNAPSEGGAYSLTKSIVYDTKGRYIKSVSDVSGTTMYEFDPVYLYLLKETSPNGLTTEYRYDSQGREVEVKLPDGNIVNTSYSWGSVNDPSTPHFFRHTSSAGSPWIKTGYDILGREIINETVGFEGISVVGKTEFNSKGEIVGQTSLLGGTPVGVTSFNYDSYSRLQNESYNTGKQITYGYNNNSVTQTINGKSFTSLYDSWGGIKSVTEPTPGGTINYRYHSNGQVKEISYPGASISIGYDAIGYQQSINDPSAGLTNFRYDAIGRLTYQRDARNKVSHFYYDNQSRLEFEKDQNLQTTRSYEYFSSSGVDKGKLKKVSSSNGTWESYQYNDQVGRITRTTKYLDAEVGSIDFNYQYDDFGNVQHIVYPGNHVVTNTYDSYGNLKSVSTSGNTIWSLETHNSSTYRYKLNNNQITTTKSFDANGLLSSIITTKGSTTLQSARYSFDAAEGRLLSREDNRSGYNLREEFEYDNLNRLTSWIIKKNGVQTDNYFIEFESEVAGNIAFKTGVGEYIYNQGQRPHAVEQISDEQGYLPAIQNITYTDFGKVETISENGYSLEIVYGPNHQRVKSVLKFNNQIQVTTYYAGLYEVKKYPDGTTKEYLYIPAADGIAAVIIKSNGDAGTIYYLHRDHLGSIVCITNQSGQVVEQANFDPWGRHRNPQTWTFNNVEPPTLLTRGFTGHEHLHEFALINMNGRVYDPVLGIFLSPDPYVQAPNFSQNFNRYSYCINNPLLYTDPSGYWFGWDDLVVATVGFITGYVSYGISTGNWWSWKAVAAGGIGATIAWVGWNTMGAGAAALEGGAGSATNFMAGVQGVFGTKAGLNFAIQYSTYTVMNSAMHSEQLMAADQKGWGGVALFGVYATTAMLSSSLNPKSITRVEGLRQWLGVSLTNNISRNMDDGEFNFKSIHIGPLGYDRGGLYTIFDKGLSGGERFDMAFETILGLTLIKTDVLLPWLKKSHCGNWNWVPDLYKYNLPISKIGYFSSKIYDGIDNYYYLRHQKSFYEYWFYRHNNRNGTFKY